MSKQSLLRRIAARSKITANYRRDPRFLNVMGFLVTKGLLGINASIPELPNKRLTIDDAIWAGVNVEPRILEVLPAAVIRFPRNFDLDPDRHPELTKTINDLRRHQTQGTDFLGIPYAKVRVWLDFPLKDGRLKLPSEKKVTKSFRLTPKAIARLRALAQESSRTETAVLEDRILAKK